MSKTGDKKFGRKTTMLFIVLVVIMLSALALYALYLSLKAKVYAPPPVRLVNLDQSVSNNGWNLTVIGVSSLEIKISHTIYYLKSENDVTLESGSLESINGTSSGFNITYFDKDGNGKISCYDVIFISNVGGSSNTAHKGYKFSLYYMDKYLMDKVILK